MILLLTAASSIYMPTTNAGEVYARQTEKKSKAKKIALAFIICGGASACLLSWFFMS